MLYGTILDSPNSVLVYIFIHVFPVLSQFSQICMNSSISAGLFLDVNFCGVQWQSSLHPEELGQICMHLSDLTHKKC